MHPLHSDMVATLWMEDRYREAEQARRRTMVVRSTRPRLRARLGRVLVRAGTRLDTPTPTSTPTSNSTTTRLATLRRV